MNKAVIQRLNALEAHSQTCERPFYLLCEEWASHPEKRTQLATEAELSEAAAAYIFTTGLKYKHTKDSECPFSSWRTDELRMALYLIEG